MSSLREGLAEYQPISNDLDSATRAVRPNPCPKILFGKTTKV